MDENGNKIWEKKHHILGNECVYSIVPIGDSILLGGEASDGSRRSFFIMKTDLKGNPLWKRTFDLWENAMFGGLIEGKGSSTLIGSVKDVGWSVIAFELDEEGNTIGEETLGVHLCPVGA